MTRFYEPDLGTDPDSPFARDAANKLVRRIYWLDMNDRTLVMVMVNGTGAHLTGTCTHKNCEWCFAGSQRKDELLFDWLLEAQQL
jgi:hypothetical protein